MTAPDAPLRKGDLIRVEYDAEYWLGTTFGTHIVASGEVIMLVPSHATITRRKREWADGDVVEFDWRGARRERRVAVRSGNGWLVAGENGLDFRDGGTVDMFDRNPVRLVPEGGAG